MCTCTSSSAVHCILVYSYGCVYSYHDYIDGVIKHVSSCCTVAPCSARHLFELTPSHSSAPIGCVTVTIGFANSQCISDSAVLYLLLPKRKCPGGVYDRPEGERFHFEESDLRVPSDAERLCGPIRIKPLIDVTGKSAQVSALVKTYSLLVTCT